MAHLFAKGVPDAFANRFAHLGPEEAPVASYLSDVAAANILWPLGDRGVAKRLHRITAPRLTLWGDLDEVNPVTNAAAWGGADSRRRRRSPPRMGCAGAGLGSRLPQLALSSLGR